MHDTPTIHVAHGCTGLFVQPCATPTGLLRNALLNSAQQAALGLADSLVIVASSTIAEAETAMDTVVWLEAHGYRELVARSVVVINGLGRRVGNTDLDQVQATFEAHVREVVRVPYDPYLHDRREIDLAGLASRTRDALMVLAGAVADDFARTGRRDPALRYRTPAVMPVPAPAGW